MVTKRSNVLLVYLHKGCGASLVIMKAGQPQGLVKHSGQSRYPRESILI